MPRKLFFAILVVFSLFPSVSCWSSSCGYQTRACVFSPDRQKILIFSTWDCGATTGFTGIIHLKESKDISPHEPADEKQVIAFFKGYPDPEMRWMEDGSIDIQCRDCLVSGEVRKEVDGIRIVYRNPEAKEPAPAFGSTPQPK